MKIRTIKNLILLSIIYFIGNSLFIEKSFAATPNTSIIYKPYYSLTAQTNISSLSNRSYNMSDGFGKSDSEFGYGAGIGAGIRGDIGKLYLGVEAFINADYALHKKATRPYRGTTDQVESEEVKITSIFNARVNVGYNFGNGGRLGNQHNNKSNNDLNISNSFIDKLTIFGSVGLRHFEYESTYTYTDYSMYYADEFIRYNDWVIAPTFGLGFIYSVSKRFDVVLGYEYSFFSIKDQIFDDPNGEGKVKIGVNTIRLGLNYVF